MPTKPVEGVTWTAPPTTVAVPLAKLVTVTVQPVQVSLASTATVTTCPTPVAAASS